MNNIENEAKQAEAMNNFMREGVSKASPQTERLAKAITGGYANPFDTLDRSAFESDDEYLDAVTKMTLERETPEYRETRKRIEDEYAKRKEAEDRERYRKEYETCKNSVRLNWYEQEAIDKEAQRLADVDLRLSKINISALSRTIAKYKEQLTEKKKDEKATGMLFNSILRGK